MWIPACFLLLCSQLHLGYTQFGNDLAQQIFNQVHESLKGTENLGERITANVHQNLAAGFQNMGNPFGSAMGSPFGSGDSLGSQISARIHNQLAPLQHLGADIQNQVHKSLMPVYAMTIKTSMASGTGGTTIAAYPGNKPRIFVIKNGERYSCNGNLQGPTCFGSLEPFDVITREDFCYSKSFASVNDQICLATAHINVQVLNDRVNCQASGGSPMLKLSRPEYRQLCGNRMPWQVRYTYYPDPNNPRAIPIPNSNPYVNCLNNQPGVCEFEGFEGLGGSSGTVISSSGGTHINYNY